MSAIRETADTCIVIVEIQMDGVLTQMGALTDSVKEVIDLDPNQIAPPPKLGTKLKSEFIKGMGRQDEKFLIILDINQILSDEELAMISDTGEQISHKVEAVPDAVDSVICPAPIGINMDSDAGEQGSHIVEAVPSDTDPVICPAPIEINMDDVGTTPG